MDVLRPHRLPEVRFVEHAPDASSRFDPRIPIAAWRTLMWSLTIRVFARRVKMQHKTEPRRWWTWVMWTLVVPVVVLSWIWAVAYGSKYLGTSRLLTAQNALVLSKGWHDTFIADSTPNWATGRALFAPVWLGIYMGVLAVVAAVIPLVAPQTLGAAKVRRSLMLRAAVFSMSPAIACFVFHMLFGSATWVVSVVGQSFGRGPWFLVDMVSIRELHPFVALLTLLTGLTWVIAWWGVTYLVAWKMTRWWDIVQIMIAQVIVLLITAVLLVIVTET